LFFVDGGWLRMLICIQDKRVGLNGRLLAGGLARHKWRMADKESRSQEIENVLSELILFEWIF